MRTLRISLFASLLVIASLTASNAQKRPRATNSGVPVGVLVQIIRAEDERRWGDNLKALLTDKNAGVRRRAALAAGRIGDELAVSALIELLQKDKDLEVRQMAAFALGEVESPKASEALYTVLGNTSEPRELSARVVEALGKIAAALPESEKDRKQELGKAILGVLSLQADPSVSPHRLTILLGLTAALRARPDGAGPVILKFLDSSDPRIVADALNTMARLRLKDSNERVRQLLGHSDPIVRANAARVIGAKEDKDAFDALLDRALHDSDLRVRVSAIRALGALKDERAVEPLVQRGESLSKPSSLAETSKNELLEISVTLGRLLPNTHNASVLIFLRRMHNLTKGEAPEIEIAFARMAPGILENASHTAEADMKNASWRRVSARAQGLAAIKTVIVGPATGSAGDSALRGAEEELHRLLDHAPPTYALPQVLRAYASYKPKDLRAVLLKHLAQPYDVFTRATAAELLADLSLEDNDLKALADQLIVELTPGELLDEPDAAIAILETFAKQKSPRADEEIKKGFLEGYRYVIRRRAASLLKENGAGDFASQVGLVNSRLRENDYRRAIARIGKKVRATVVTSKGAFTIEFLPEDAPLTVDNFVQLARKGYFNGQTVPRVVPNFVIQTGDPRGDQNGGPGYSIRCEINEVRYERAAVGMALSGKDTGGSQWFVTHSPQPHLDGGYTIFGRVISGMEVVDNIARGDTIRRVTVIER